MRKLKKLTAIIMSIIMVASLSVQALASTQDAHIDGFYSFISDDGLSSKTSFEMNGNIHSIRVEEFDDGSIKLYEYLNGQLYYYR